MINGTALYLSTIESCKRNGHDSFLFLCGGKWYVEMQMEGIGHVDEVSLHGHERPVVFLGVFHCMS